MTAVSHDVSVGDMFLYYRTVMLQCNERWTNELLILVFLWDMLKKGKIEPKANIIIQLREKKQAKQQLQVGH